MKFFKMVLQIFLITFLIFMLFSPLGIAQEYKWKMTSPDVRGDNLTVFGETFAELVKERSEGRMEIEVFPQGTLGTQLDIIEIVQLGQAQIAAASTASFARFVPQTQVLSLQYLWPKDNPREIVQEVFENGDVVKLLGEKYAEKGFHFLGAWVAGWTRVTSNVPIHSPEDCKGLKHRVMASPILVKAYNKYGFNAQSLNYGEVYGALQTNLIDSQVNPAYSIWAMSFHEVQDYITNLWNEMHTEITVFNKEAFDSLPEDLQQILVDCYNEVLPEHNEWVIQYDKESIENIKNDKPSITFYELTNEEIEPFKKLAWEDDGPATTYVEIGGDGAQEILDALLADIETAIQNQ